MMVIEPAYCGGLGSVGAGMVKFLPSVWFVCLLISFLRKEIMVNECTAS